MCSVMAVPGDWAERAEHSAVGMEGSGKSIGREATVWVAYQDKKAKLKQTVKKKSEIPKNNNI